MTLEEKNERLKKLEHLLHWARSYTRLPSSSGSELDEWRKNLHEIDRLLYGTCPWCDGTGILRKS